MASSAKRCLYEVLGLSRDCTPDEIRSAYKKLALQRHPDKLVQSGVSEPEATAQFQELVNAYEVLSDPRERSWYDSHRSQILYSDSAANSSSSSSAVPNLFSFFSNSVYNGYSDTGKGFYKVYAEVFDKVYRNEVNFAQKLGLGLPKEAPLMANLDSPYAQVTAFYNYWLGFVTIMDFCWVDQYDVMAGPNRKSRRVMEEENKKLRKKARREYNDSVRGLAEFVKKRDKRVIDMHMKRKEEMERKREEERERRKELERQKAERARKYEEPEWTRVDEEMEDEDFEESLEEDGKKEQLYCVVCGKKFKSEKQWKNHEQSKKHKEKVAELRKAFRDEDKAEVDAGEEEAAVEEDGSGYYPADNGVDGITKQFEDSVGIEDRKINDSKTQSTDDDGLDDIEEVSGSEGVGTTLVSDDDETSFLEAMISGCKKNLGSKHQPKASAQQVKSGIDVDEMDFMGYNNTKDTRKNRGGRRRRGRKPDEEAVQVDVNEIDEQAEEANMPEDGADVEGSPSHSSPENGTDVKGDDSLEKTHKLPKQPVDRKGTPKKENTKSKNAAKGRKQKATTAKVSGNVCEKCGEEFESRNKLHKHLSDTGHASLKYR